MSRLADEMLSPPPTVWTTLVQTSTGAKQICTLLRSSIISCQQVTGCSGSSGTRRLPRWMLDENESSSNSRDREMATCLSPQVCRLAASDARAAAETAFFHEGLPRLLSATSSAWNASVCTCSRVIRRAPIAPSLILCSSRYTSRIWSSVVATRAYASETAVTDPLVRMLSKLGSSCSFIPNESQ